MRKSLTIAKRGAALALAGAMACSCALGAAAQGTVKKEETVYATLSSDGTVQKLTDSVWLHDDAGLSGYATDTGLSDITMLKDTENPQADGSKLTFGEGTDAYYQGTADAALPVTAEITYTLDGTAMTAEELAGKSGHLVMHVSLTNNSYQMKTIGGVSRRVCTPFVTVIAATLDTDTFTGITAEHGTIETDASKDLVAYVCLPGMKECFDGLLKDDLSQISDKLYDDVTLEADVTDFEMPMLYIAAATDAADFSKESELSDFNDLFDELDGLDDKLNDMMDGVDELLKGSNDLNNGASELYNGIQTLDTGAATLQTGAHDAATGAGTLSSGLNTLSGNSQTLRDGAGKIADAVLASANSQLKAAGAISNDLTWDNYATVLSGHMNVTDAQIAAARKTVHDTVQQQMGADMTDAQLDTLIYLTVSDANHDMKAAGAQMQQAAADTANGGAIYNAEAALATASGKSTSVAAVSQVLLAQGYTAVAAQLPSISIAISDGADTTAADVIIVMAAQMNPADAAAFTSDLQTAGDKLQNHPEDNATAISNAENALAATPNHKASEVVAAQPYLVGAAYQRILSDSMMAAAASTTVDLGGGITTSAADILLTMAVQSGNSDVTAALTAAATRLTNANNVLAAQTAAQTSEGQQAVLGYLTAAVQAQGESAFKSALDQLNSVNTFVKGINDYTAGVDKAASGAGTLKTGLDTLASGTDTLKTGADKLLTGASTLKNGTGTLVDGVQELYDGVNEAYNKLENGDASDLTTDDLQNIKDTLDAVKTQRESYKSFAGDAGSEGSVKFVMKVSAEKAEDTETAAVPADAAKTGNFFTNLWQRIVALFHN